MILFISIGTSIDLAQLFSYRYLHLPKDHAVTQGKIDLHTMRIPLQFEATVVIARTSRVDGEISRNL